MTLIEIKAAVDQGQTVHWINSNYTVIKDNDDKYFISYRRGSKVENCIGLTHADGQALNGKESEFYLGE